MHTAFQKRRRRRVIHFFEGQAAGWGVGFFTKKVTEGMNFSLFPLYKPPYAPW